MLLDGNDVTTAIRKFDITTAIHHAADNAAVRKTACRWQRAAAADDNVVTEGRDQGTVVFPDAECKIFLTAAEQERARRRHADLLARGEDIPFDEVLANQRLRDHRDVSRPVGALMKADDAIEVSTDGLTPEEVVAQLEQIVRSSNECERRLGSLMLWYAIMWCPCYAISQVLFRFQFHRASITSRSTGPVLLVSNHQSNLDPVLVGVACPRQLKYLARQGLFFFPFNHLDSRTRRGADRSRARRAGRHSGHARAAQAKQRGPRFSRRLANARRQAARDAAGLLPAGAAQPGDDRARSPSTARSRRCRAAGFWCGPIRSALRFGARLPPAQYEQLVRCAVDRARGEPNRAGARRARAENCPRARDRAGFLLAKPQEFAASGPGGTGSGR